jgi:hypothetical protein
MSSVTRELELREAPVPQERGGQEMMMGPKLAVAGGWPDKMTREQATKYLKEERDLPIDSPKTLANWHSAGRGPKCVYFGNKPFYPRVELDRFADNAFTDEPSHRRRRREQQKRSAAE